MTDPTDAAAEAARLRALLAATRLERDELARQLRAVLGEAPVMVVGQAELPLPGLRPRPE
jgi:hypothetical protein